MDADKALQKLVRQAGNLARHKQGKSVKDNQKTQRRLQRKLKELRQWQ